MKHKKMLMTLVFSGKDWEIVEENQEGNEDPCRVLERGGLYYSVRLYDLQ